MLPIERGWVGGFSSGASLCSFVSLLAAREPCCISPLMGLQVCAKLCHCKDQVTVAPEEGSQLLSLRQRLDAVAREADREIGDSCCISRVDEFDLDGVFRATA